MLEKEKKFKDIESWLLSKGLNIEAKDESRPWGGFFVITESTAALFIDCFFSSLDKNSLLSGKISPKILLVAPHKKLSWQYHHRRAELWKLVDGSAAIVRSQTDQENEAQPMTIGSIVSLQQGERHRLVGAEEWGIIAEIWQHTDPANPSNEDDIVRIQDDFGR